MNYNIDDYDLFIFDFDGTIMDTEKYHYYSYLKAFKDYDNNIELDINTYFRFVHNIDRSEYYNFLKDHNITDLDELYIKKSTNYKFYINNHDSNYIGNFNNFIQKLKNKNKELIIVTNSSIESINVFLNKFSILNSFDKIYTKEDFKTKKPNPECYLKIQEIYSNKRMIAFEDSYQGIHALSHAKLIKAIHISDDDYYFNELIKNKYNIERIKNYDCFN